MTKVLFVKNLSYDTTKESLAEAFEGCSTARIQTFSDTGKPRGFGFVEFDSTAEAQKALDAMQGESVDGRQVRVDFASELGSPAPNRFGGSGGRDGNQEAGKTKVLFVKNLSYDTTKESLAEAFEGCSTARIQTFSDTGKPRGFGFVEFDSIAEAQKAHDAMQGESVDGRQVRVDFASELGSPAPNRFGGSGGRGGNQEAGKTKVLFVKNLSYDTTKESLAEAFEGCSTARIQTFSDTGKPRGFGFVEFDSTAEAQKAYDAMQGESVDGRQVRVDFASERGSPAPNRFGGSGGRGGRGGRDGRGGRGGFRGGRGRGRGGGQ